MPIPPYTIKLRHRTTYRFSLTRRRAVLLTDAITHPRLVEDGPQRVEQRLHPLGLRLHIEQPLLIHRGALGRLGLPVASYPAADSRVSRTLILITPL